jgi:Txe/YoeB family toxin of toxin-antitoxin system
MPAAWDDYLYWQGQECKQLRRINQLIQACLRDPFVGIGKPELLRENLSGRRTVLCCCRLHDPGLKCSTLSRTARGKP